MPILCCRYSHGILWPANEFHHGRVLKTRGSGPDSAVCEHGITELNEIIETERPREQETSESFKKSLQYSNGLLSAVRLCTFLGTRALNIQLFVRWARTLVEI
jgi:hypothetical protein